MPTPTSQVTLLPITTLNNLDYSLLDSSLLESIELQEATLLVNSIVRSSTLKTPIKQYIEQLGVAFERTILEISLLQKENAKFKELLQIRKERKKGKRIVVKRKFVFNTKEILELVKEAEVEALKGKSKKRRIIRATTPKIKDKDKEGIKESIYKSESDCIIVASSRLNTRQEVRNSVWLPLLSGFPYSDVKPSEQQLALKIFEYRGSLFTRQGAIALFKISADTIRLDCVVVAPTNSHFVLQKIQEVIRYFKHNERILVEEDEDRHSEHLLTQQEIIVYLRLADLTRRA